MIYRVTLDGVNIYDEYPELTLLAPSVTMELNSAGSFSFAMPPGHISYEMPRLLSQDIEVYEDGELIWFGRPIRINTDFYLQKSVSCEGALAFLNDSVQRPDSSSAVSVRVLFQNLLERHNEQVADNRRFLPGRVTAQDLDVPAEEKYENTWQALKRLCLDQAGGYLFPRREDGVNYLDWLADMPDTGGQPVQLAVNLLDLTRSMDGTAVKTAVLPLGAEIRGKKLTVFDVNAGFDIIDSEAVREYGRITEIVEFNTITTPAELLEAGQKWLSERQFDGLSIQAGAAELHYLDNSWPAFRIGQMVHCTSSPHLLDRKFPLVRLSLRLDTAIKQITVGSTGKTRLSDLYAAERM